MSESDACPLDQRVGGHAGVLEAHRQARRSVGRIILAQLSVAAAGALIALAVLDHRAALSAFVGGAICAVAGAAMAVRAFRVPVDADPRALLRGFFVGEALKIGVTVAGFWLAVRYLDVNWLVLILTFIAALAVYWLALATTAGSPRSGGGTV